MEAACSSVVPLPEPVDIGGSLELFRRSGDDLIDRWDGARLLRATVVGQEPLAFVARARGSRAAASFEVGVEDPRWLPSARAIVAQTFVAAPSDYAALLEVDPVLRRLDARFPGIRQIRQLDLFTALIRCISAQQVNLRWAATTRRRLAEAFGMPHTVAGETVYSLAPERLAEVDPARIRLLQFTTSKAAAIVAVAQAIARGEARLEVLAALPDEDVIDCLTRIRGIGRWSAEWVLARTLGRPTVVAGDLGVRKAVGLAYLGTPRPTEAEVRRATAHWSTAASSAQALLLYALAERALPLPPTA